MTVEIASPAEQASGAFDGGKILERKPIGFPGEDSKFRPFSALFYWAHAWTETGGEIGLHPHKGFEIATFVLRGSVEHFDTSGKEWISLREGDVQIIRSGRGISHAERMLEGASIFQIWFDPGLEKTLTMDPSYSDYRAEAFPRTQDHGIDRIIIAGEGSPLRCLAPVGIERVIFPDGRQVISGLGDSAVGFFILKGQLTFGSTRCREGDFIKIENEGRFEFSGSGGLELFWIQAPGKLNYVLYADYRGLG